MKNNLSLTWDLETIFEGGSESSELKQYIQAAQDWIETFKQQVTPFAEKPELDQLIELTETIRQVSMHNGEIGAFVSCLTAQDVNDKYARRLVGIRNELNAATQKLITKFSFALSRVDDQEWQSWLEDQQLIEIRFVLSELRDEAKDKLPEDQEQLITDLEIDGYHAWGEMYDTIVGSMTVAWENEQLSIGQLENKLNHANREVRELAFQKLEQAWLDKADLFTETLNHLAGFRLQTYAHRKWDDVLKEPLNYNRMTNKTLSTMWETIVKNKQAFYEYLNRKAEKFGLDQLAWYDLEAPISQDVKEINYQEAADIIIKQFGQYSERMAEYATLAFEESWIEAEDRPGKRPGGFCTSFPESKQSRIFMTYSNTASNMATLAHELGHGYHQYVMDEIDLLNQNYAMNVAETASTLAEMIVADAMVEEATTKEERLVLIEDKIQRSVAFFMNIHARFLFETRFYQARKEGVVSTEQLNELMEQAQREAYGDQLSTYHPIFWASKLHFHITDVPFYNFPYTFGYLFSLGIYAYAKSDKKNFANFYDALLKDTGRMTVEELAKKHLNVDLEQPEFWQRAIDLCIEDVKQFIELTN
ncbi:M3 family oligoendopeptidase [Amphibacillus xylanus]|uniref:Peptidase M3 family protein n=1 Tax=Amphibacillus xylanus (strain ATCC 51415 / DSM 6626 / JCM 7361 / LMG 17667 / NBRC 15112 / Ep01) TaxID=698758 RepID=K0J4R8_AMPXN|nr:M3 family oligoendopeptidase [Amphibacillus xylanus]BAM47776.1 peptidase M3 family protein [Amphibacillus xylanus NBRC 15112]